MIRLRTIWRASAVGLVCVVSAACTAADGASPLPTAIESTGTAEPSLAASPSATPSESPERPAASPSPTAEPMLAILRSTVDGLRLRGAPDLSAAEVQFLTGNPVVRGINAGQLVAALDGPISSDGYDWYLLQVIGGGPGAELLGWAATPQDGDPWLVPSELECPAWSLDLATTMALGAAGTLYCTNGEGLTLEGYVVTGFGCNVMGLFEPAWLAHPCANMSFISPAPIRTVDRPTFVHYPAPGVTNPTLTFTDEQVVRIVGHYDDPAAASCVIEPADEPDPGSPGYEASDPRADVAVCRLRFVVTEVTAVP